MKNLNLKSFLLPLIINILMLTNIQLVLKILFIIQFSLFFIKKDLYNYKRIDYKTKHIRVT